jgi:hypothetical protein
VVSREANLIHLIYSQTYATPCNIYVEAIYAFLVATKFVLSQQNYQVQVTSGIQGTKQLYGTVYLRNQIDMYRRTTFNHKSTP